MNHSQSKSFLLFWCVVLLYCIVCVVKMCALVWRNFAEELVMHCEYLVFTFFRQYCESFILHILVQMGSYLYVRNDDSPYLHDSCRDLFLLQLAHMEHQLPQHRSKQMRCLSTPKYKRSTK